MTWISIRLVVLVAESLAPAFSDWFAQSHFYLVIAQLPMLLLVLASHVCTGLELIG